MVAIGHSRYHYFGRFTYAAARCKSIFGNADIAAVVVEMIAYALSSRMAWRTPGKIGWGGGPLIPFFPLGCWKAANAGGRHMRSSS
jgi:hypothetical protein